MDTSLRTARHLEWEGCYNARDLGGLRTVDGGETRWGAIIRSDSLDHLTPAGWSALRAHGIRTIIDLRGDQERSIPERTADVVTVHVPLDEPPDVEFADYCCKNELDGSPLYYGPFLDRSAQRCAKVLAAIAAAQPGGVVVHCAVGRDRTGLIALLLLALSDVTPDDIAADYELSAKRLKALYASLGQDDYGPVAAEILRKKKTSARDTILTLLSSLDITARMRSAGLSGEDAAALRARLVGPAA
jgi:protein-tyrosine phosphatase